MLDIGRKTASLYETVIKNAKTAFVNARWAYLRSRKPNLARRPYGATLGATEAYTVVGGGDSNHRYGEVRLV